MPFFRSRHERVAGAILLGGFAAAFFIYLSAGPALGTSDEHPEDSKRYLRQMEVYGGTANVLGEEVRERFAGLWRGRTLAFTVGCLAVILAGLAHVVLRPPARADDGKPPAEPGDVRRG